MIRGIRAALQDVVAAAGINTRIVPHQFRHTYASDMLRGGVTFPAVMKLLGHTTPAMTRRALPEGSNRRLLDRIANRLVKIVARLLQSQPTQKMSRD